MVAHLLNIDEELAEKAANKLGLEKMPQPAEAARPTLKTLEKSDKLSILKNSKGTFKGRKIGVLMTDGIDGDLFLALRDAAKKEGAMVEVVAPRIGGVKDSKEKLIKAQQQVEGGPSVLYDAVVLLATKDGGQMLAKEPAARDFVSDAFVHCKFIGYCKTVQPLLEAAGIEAMLDDGCIPLDSADAMPKFIEICRDLRYWQRELKNDNT